jgi:alkylated DNA repair dioxygenase AlkB
VTNACSPSTVPGAWRPTLFEVGSPAPDPDFTGLVRHDLDGDAWVDHVTGWMAGGAELYEAVVTGVQWSAPDVLMYGRVVAQPRLSGRWAPTDAPAAAAAALAEAQALLSARYGRELTSIGANLYRDGNDSVAWHGDRVAREQVEALIAIVSLGEARPFRLRPRAGGPSLGFELGGGDLLVMGGSCQRTWEHSVPKVRRAVGPRVSVTFREHRAGDGFYDEPPSHDGPATVSR